MACPWLQLLCERPTVLRCTYLYSLVYTCSRKRHLLHLADLGVSKYIYVRTVRRRLSGVHVNNSVVNGCKSSSSDVQPWVCLGLKRQMSSATSILGIRPPRPSLPASSAPSIHFHFGRPRTRWPPGFVHSIFLGN